jgi:hypothetical protein
MCLSSRVVSTHPFESNAEDRTYESYLKVSPALGGDVGVQKPYSNRILPDSLLPKSLVERRVVSPCMVVMKALMQQANGDDHLLDTLLSTADLQHYRAPKVAVEVAGNLGGRVLLEVVQGAACLWTEGDAQSSQSRE